MFWQNQIVALSTETVFSLKSKPTGTKSESSKQQPPARIFCENIYFGICTESEKKPTAEE